MTTDETTETTDDGEDAPGDQHTGGGSPASETPSGHADADTADGADPKPTNREARYRRQLRDTEAERDQLAAQLDTLRRERAETLARGVIAEPAGLWAAGVTVADLLAEDGRIDPDKVTAAAERARGELGLARAPRRTLVVPGEGSTPPPAQPRPSFEDAFAPR